jgi:hypothetical protein
LRAEELSILDIDGRQTVGAELLAHGLVAQALGAVFRDELLGRDVDLEMRSLPKPKARDHGKRHYDHQSVPIAELEERLHPLSRWHGLNYPA